MGFKAKTKEAIDIPSPSNPDLVAVIDADWPKYTVAAAGETRGIKAIHKKSGNEKEFKTRTEFWGRGKAITGWLGDVNKEREEEGKPLFTREDFDIEDTQTPEPLANVLHSTRIMIQSALEQLGTDNYKAFVGEGNSFRLGQSTLMKYKGNREDLLKPLHLDAVSDYIIERLKAQVISNIEVDDKVIIEAFGKEDHVVVAVDKDAMSQPVKVFNPNRPNEGIIDCDCFGRLWLEGSGSNEKVRGYGRIHLLYQMISQDTADNYKFNCASDVKWGSKSAYKALVDCNNNQEAWDAVCEVVKKVYPEPKEVIGWRGDEILIDGWYVLDEMFNMARMKTHENDFTTLRSWLDAEKIRNSYKP